MEKEGSIPLNNGNSFLSIPSDRPQESIICQFLGIIIYISVYGAYVLHFLTRQEYLPVEFLWKTTGLPNNIYTSHIRFVHGKQLFSSRTIIKQENIT